MKTYPYNKGKGSHWRANIQLKIIFYSKKASEMLPTTSQSYFLPRCGADLEIRISQILVLVLQIVAGLGRGRCLGALVLKVIHLHRAGPVTRQRKKKLNKEEDVQGREHAAYSFLVLATTIPIRKNAAYQLGNTSSRTITEVKQR